MQCSRKKKLINPATRYDKCLKQVLNPGYAACSVKMRRLLKTFDPRADHRLCLFLHNNSLINGAPRIFKTKKKTRSEVFS